MNFNEQLREILDHAIERGIMKEHALHDIDPKPYAIKAIHTLIEEAIGPDDKEVVPNDVFVKMRNIMRAELRAKFNVEEG